LPRQISNDKNLGLEWVRELEMEQALVKELGAVTELGAVKELELVCCHVGLKPHLEKGSKFCHYTWLGLTNPKTGSLAGHHRPSTQWCQTQQLPVATGNIG